MLTVCTWLWGDKYGADYVAKLAAGIRRNLNQPHRFLCMVENFYGDVQDSDDVTVVPIIRDLHLLEHQGCFVRLRMFDHEWQRDRGLKEGDRLVCLDLDVVITGPLDHLFDRPEPFVILQGANSENPNPFNGSLMMLRAGAHSEVWSDFSLEKAQAVPFYAFPDDQAWLFAKLPQAAGWQCGASSGVYAFQKPGWPKGDDLPKDARIVAFPGWRDPSKFAELDWVAENWRA